MQRRGTAGRGANTCADALTRARTLARVPAAYAAAAAALAAAAAGERSGAWHIQPVVEAGGGCAGRGLSGDRLHGGCNFLTHIPVLS